MTLFAPDDLRAAVGGRWLARPDAGPDPQRVGIDTRTDLRGAVFVAIRGERHDGHDHLEAAVGGDARVAIVDDETRVPGRLAGMGVLLVPDARAALGRLARAWRRTLKGARVIGITGSCGKTTTRRLVDAVLATTFEGTSAERSFNNDIGVPLTLLRARPGDRYVIVEIGTNAPGEIAALSRLCEPDVAVITNIGPAHLEAFGDLESIAQEKAGILGSLRPGGLAVLHDDPLLDLAARTVTPRLRFGTSSGADLRVSARGATPTPWLEVNDVRRYPLGLPGRHNTINALAAIAIGRRFGVVEETIASALAAVQPEPMRMTRVERDGIVFWNDAYNANPHSMTAALETFDEVAADATRRVVVLGDMLELGADGPALHRAVGPTLSAGAIDRVIVVGALASEMASGLDARTVVRHDTLTPHTLVAIQSELRAGDAVLLKGSRALGLERVLEPVPVGNPAEGHGCSTTCSS